MFENGFMTQQFAFGGEEGKDKFDEQIIYRSSLQNFLIDNGEEVILVDTGLDCGTPAPAKKLGMPMYMGDKVADYMDSFLQTGYKPEQVTKILITHKHPDHSGAIKYFPNAKIYISKEDAEAMKLEGDNVVIASYSDGAYHNFPKSQKVTNGIYFIEAKGHTLGNSIVIAEDGDKFYMFQGDVTYCDAALKADKLSIVFEDIKQARQTLNEVRQFVKENPTVYLSTHCPEGVENLEMQRIMKLN